MREPLIRFSFIHNFFFSFLKRQILPVAKFSFYSGNASYAVVQKVLNLYERCKELLDTNGNGWGDPITDFSQFRTKLEPLDLKKQSSEDDSMKACANLALNQNDNDEEDMLVPLPKIETTENEEPSTIWLPLKRKHIFNINSKSSAFILFRYFVVVTQCYAYQGINQSIFNQNLKVWLVDEVVPYLNDDKLYPAFGAVLRILETVKASNENGYHGTKSKPFGHRQFPGDHPAQFSDNDEVISDLYSDDDDFDWWSKIALIASCGIVALLLLTFLVARICCETKRKDASTDPPDKPSFMQKFKKLLMRNTHRAEADEFYQYRKVPRHPRRIVFENEKRCGLFRKQKTKKSGSKEWFDLPLLGEQTESEEEIVVHESFSSKKESSDSSGRRFKSAKTASKETFKISEDSDDSRLKNSKPQTVHPFKGQNEPTGVDLHRLARRLSRSKSPTAKPVKRQNDSGVKFVQDQQRAK